MPITPTVEEQRDGAYRERAQLLAWLATLCPAVIAPAPDVDEPGWEILYLAPEGQQLTWHIAPADVDLFEHVGRAPADDPRVQWDGHTTAEKYERIRGLLAPLLPRRDPGAARAAVEAQWPDETEPAVTLTPATPSDQEG